MDDARIYAAGTAILRVIAGMRTDEGNAALCSALGTACGGIAQISGASIEEAEAMIDGIATDAKAMVRKHWGTFETEELH